VGRTLFVGCSHSMGYNGNVSDSKMNKAWNDNNYAEIYSEVNNKDIVIMASAGTGNRVLPRFVANAFKLYDDIDEVFVQSTYWGRFPVAINPTLTDKEIFPLDFFLDKNTKSNKIERYSIALLSNEKYLETFLKPTAEDYDTFPYVKETKPFYAEPDVRRSSHMYLRMWHYSNTHLEQEDFFSNIALCDMLCTYNNVPLYVWNINDRCYLPKETSSFYTDLKSTSISNVDAINYVKQHTEIKTVDGEHYSKNVHQAIAKYYIPYIKEQR